MRFSFYVYDALVSGTSGPGEGLPLLGLANSQNEQLTSEHAFHMQTTQSRIYIPTCLLSSGPLCKGYCPSALSHHRVRCQTTRELPHLPKPARSIQTLHSKASPIPAAATTVKFCAPAFPSLSAFWPTWCFPTRPCMSACAPSPWEPWVTNSVLSNANCALIS